jgi:hypothetical protein
MPAQKPLAQQLVAIDDFLIDCSLSENHTFDSDVTEYPVESGSNVTDNIRPLPLVVEMECLVSNSPIGPITSTRSLVRGEGDDQALSSPVNDAYDLLQVIREQRKPVTIRTSLRTFENMALKSLSIPRGPALDELRFTATFIQIQTVENRRTIRVSTPTATGKKKVTKSPEPVDMRLVLIDPSKKQWWDPDVGLWRKKASFNNVKLREDTATVTTITDKSKWHLWRKEVEIRPANLQVTHTVTSSGGRVSAVKIVDDPFDAIRHTQPHPVRQQIAVTLSQCFLHDFTIKKSIPNGSEEPLRLKNRIR